MEDKHGIARRFSVSSLSKTEEQRGNIMSKPNISTKEDDCIIRAIGLLLCKPSVSLARNIAPENKILGGTFEIIMFPIISIKENFHADIKHNAEYCFKDFMQGYVPAISVRGEVRSSRDQLLHSEVEASRVYMGLHIKKYFIKIILTDLS